MAHDTKLSRKLSYLLRHGAVKEGIQIDSAGFVAVPDLLQHFSGAYTETDIRAVVQNNDKQRFLLQESNGIVRIRANQGHSIRDIDADQLLERIEDPNQAKVCIHGTYLCHLDSIMKSGLQRMKRNHIHFAAGEVDDNQVISGMRTRCEVKIYINVEAMLRDGIPLYRSSNNVLLSPGPIPPKYFAKVVRCKK
mmetsp:Transcript_20806/g.38883  ORF Transcript_20806/g.38883 Transcript_20806/m.38883 type:complete len:193 (+) Transcript_20806:631-1209(+)|eukprot:CAMPEP_0178736786 /NCGR_PEP_ID=MMETSP0744-20121128/2627_1 /TAXON_ID=913974 /ORGANISM="Nitzschia punctata, Strain CCMP561" /LENGTH=192 /DNA_ID=CAMNT_0020389285 /DNA_START=483 /DNA_END=1061 /DNA_ORIENTATION=-